MTLFVPQKPQPAKRYFCFNLLKNKLTIGLWNVPDSYYLKFPGLSTLNCSSYSKFGIRWKRLLFEIIWNKKHYSFDSSF